MGIWGTARKGLTRVRVKEGGEGCNVFFSFSEAESIASAQRATIREVKMSGTVHRIRQDLKLILSVHNVQSQGKTKRQLHEVYFCPQCLCNACNEAKKRNLP